MKVPTQQLYLPETEQAGVSLFVRREDLAHPTISGNKYRKLKYNLQQAALESHGSLLTFGGAFSNHIAATAYAGKAFGFQTIGIIRGDELTRNYMENPTLAAAREQGMQLEFVSRSAYRQRDQEGFRKDLETQFGPFYLLPEGGTNALAVKGCEEILSDEDREYDILCCSVGTGGTLAGIINASHPDQQVLGFPALRADHVKKDICSFVNKSNWRLAPEYHFGGYAKINEALIAFINTFRRKTDVPLDPIYTGKLFYGVLDMVGRKLFRPGTRILVIHTGGLQGVAGMNQLLKKKKLPLINI